MPGLAAAAGNAALAADEVGRPARLAETAGPVSRSEVGVMGRAGYGPPAWS